MTKIIITLLAVVLPFSLFNKEKLKHLSGLTGPSLLLFRLYAVSISALLVNYGFGLMHAHAQHFPLAAVIVGIVSNGGATALLVKQHFIEQSNTSLSSIYSIAFFGFVTAGLLLAVFFQQIVLRPLW
jgi:hypothetical protein